MVKIYIRRIKAGEMTLSDVPLRWRADTESALMKESEDMK